MLRDNFKIFWSSRSHNYTTKEINYVTKVLQKADPLTHGVYLESFEKKFKKYLNCKGKVFGVTSGASAMELAAALLQLKKDDEIIIPAHTYCASALPFCRYGAKIRWADINLETMTIDIDHVKRLINNKTKVIIGVHLYGAPCDIKQLRKITKNTKIYLIEDCAQALGAKIDNIKVGNFSNLAIFSFHAQKNMTTMGQGGVIVVNKKELQKHVPGLRHNGHRRFFNKKNYWSPAMIDVCEDIKGVVPFNFPMTEVQAALGIKLLDRIDKLNTVRQKRAKKLINSLKVYNFLKFQKNKKNYTNVYHLLPARIDTKIAKFDRNQFIRIMSSKYKIQIIVQFYPLYRYDFFKKRFKEQIKLKNTDLFFYNMISFPFHHWMSDKDLNYIISSTKKTLDYLLKLNK